MKVREILTLLKRDGWFVVVIVGSHRQLKHPEKRGRVTVAGHLADEIHPKTLKTILMQAGLKKTELNIMRYVMIIEPGDKNFSAYLPDLPGCVVTGETLEQVRQRMHEAIELHLAGMREDGLPIPRPTILADYVEAA